MNRFNLLFLALFLQLTLTSFAKETPSFTPSLQIGFVENKGQVKNLDGAINKDVLYLFRTGNMHVQLRKNGFSYELFNEIGTQSAEELLQDPSQLPTPISYKIHRIDINFKDANSSIKIEEKETENGELIYHEKSKAGSSFSIKHFKRIIYTNVYPSIDIEFLISENEGKQQFKYNIILHPGADADLVKLNILGSDQTRINCNGALSFETSCGNFEEKIPVSYELAKNGKIGNPIESKYVQLDKNIFGFGLNQRVSSKTRVIDPLLWCSYYGGPSTEISINLKGDTLGNVFITGNTASSSNIATAGAYQATYMGTSDYDIFLAKFSTDGILLWATYMGGSSNENVYGLEVTKEGNIVIVGQTLSVTGFGTAGSYQPVFGGSTDGFISLFGSSGNLIWSTYFGGAQSDDFKAVAEDNNGDLVVVGSNSSGTVFNYTGVHQANNAGQTDIVIVKVSKTGAVIWATYYGGTLAESASGICTDLNNNIYITGTSNSTSGMISSNPYQSTLSGNLDGVIAKFSSNGQLVFGTYFGGLSSDFPRDIKINAEGNLAISGYTYSSSGFPLLNAYRTAFTSSNSQGFVAMMDSSGSLLWSTFFGGDLFTVLLGSCFDKLGNIYFAGYTTCTIDIATVGSIQEQISGGYDGFFGSFSKSGALNWSTYFGGTQYDYAWKPYVDKNLNLFVLGYTNSDSGMSFGTVHQDTLYGTAFDCFLLKMSLDTNSGALSNNTIGTDQTLCGTSVAADLIGSSPSGGSGSYSYSWLQSSTGIAGSFVIASGTNTNKDYSPGSISSQTYFKRAVSDGVDFDTSNVITIKLGSSFHAGFTVNKAIQCLRSNEFIFTDTTSATGLTYDWDFGNGATSTNQSETISYAYQAANVYRVRLITSFGGSCADTNYKMVYTVSDPIAKNITGIDQVRRLDTASYSIPHTEGSRYSWVFDKGQLKGNGTGNQIQIKWIAVGTTQLKVVETSSGNCLGDTAYLDVTISPALDIEELTNENAFQVYPNPNNGSFVIGGLNQKEFTVNVYDARGAMVKTQVIQGETRIEIDNARAGLYVIQLINKDGMVYQKKMQINPE